MTRRAQTIWVNGALFVIAVVTLFPLLWMVSVSVMAPGEADTFPPPLVPADPSLDNYRELLVSTGIGRAFVNSLALSIAATLIALTFNVMAGYAFAKLRFAGRELLFRGLVSSLVIPGQVAMIPLFLLLKNLGLINTYVGVLIPWMSTVFGIFLVRQYALSIPDELLEAARLEGAGEFRIFRAIVLPILAPILVTLAVFTFLMSWNDFLWPLIILPDSDMYTLPVALAALSREHVQDSGLMMAGAVLAVLPVLVLFVALQRYFVRAVLTGAVKG